VTAPGHGPFGHAEADVDVTISYVDGGVMNPWLKPRGLCLVSTAIRNPEIPLWFHRPTHQGSTTNYPSWPRHAGPGALRAQGSMGELSLSCCQECLSPQTVYHGRSAAFLPDLKVRSLLPRAM
jgi:hypothetical protein